MTKTDGESYVIIIDLNWWRTKRSMYSPNTTSCIRRTVTVTKSPPYCYSTSSHEFDWFLVVHGDICKCRIWKRADTDDDERRATLFKRVRSAGTPSRARTENRSPTTICVRSEWFVRSELGKDSDRTRVWTRTLKNNKFTFQSARTPWRIGRV